MIPERATVYVCAIESEKLRLQNRSAKFFFSTNKKYSTFYHQKPTGSCQTYKCTLKLTIFQLFLDFSQFHKNKQWEIETISNFFEDQYLMVFWKYAYNYWIAWIQLVRFPFKVWRSQKSKFGLMHTCTSLPIIFTFWQICISRNSES